MSGFGSIPFGAGPFGLGVTSGTAAGTIAISGDALGAVTEGVTSGTATGTIAISGAVTQGAPATSGLVFLVQPRRGTHRVRPRRHTIHVASADRRFTWR